MMTGPGTNTYLLGERQIAVIDPGPAIAEHLENIIEKSKPCIRWILVTHTHPDHSPGVRALAERSGAEVLGMPAPEGEHQDKTFVASRVLADGDVLATDEFELQAVHTPGHASNHVCYLHRQLNWLFTGDHVIDGSTVVIDPPDGNMRHYIESLRRCKALDVAALAPGHGEVIDDPERRHRLDHRAPARARGEGAGGDARPPELDDARAGAARVPGDRPETVRMGRTLVARTCAEIAGRGARFLICRPTSHSVRVLIYR